METGHKYGVHAQKGVLLFGIWCSKYGPRRNLIIAYDGHHQSKVIKQILFTMRA